MKNDLGWLYAALAIILSTYRHHPLWGGLAALCASLAFETHPHAAVTIVGSLAAYPLLFGRTLLRQRHFWAFVLGGICGLGWYLAIHILPYPQSYAGLNTFHFGSTHLPPLLTLRLPIVLKSLTDMVGVCQNTHVAFLLMSNILFGIILLIVVIFMARQQWSRFQRIQLFLTIILMASYALLIHSKILYYDIYVSPMLFISCTLGMQKIRERYLGTRLALIPTILIIIFLGTGSFVYSVNTAPLLSDLEAKISSHIETNDRVALPLTYWFALSDRDFYAWEAIPYHLRFTNGSVETTLNTIRPDIFIYDENNLEYIATHPSPAVYGTALFVPKHDLDQFLQQYGSKIAEFDNTLYATVTLYRIDWTSYDAAHPDSSRR